MSIDSSTDIPHPSEDATSPVMQRWGTVFFAVVLIVLALVVYGRSVDYPFHYDDLHSIVENPHIRSLENIPAFFYRPDFFSADARGAMYRPLLLVSYSLNYALDKYTVEFYHWFNIGLHLCNSLLLFALLRLWYPDSTLCYIASLLFFLHPVNVEASVYISSRSESLCALFSLTASYAHIRSFFAPRWSKMWYAAGLFCFALALLSKSVAVVLPAILIFSTGQRGGGRMDLLARCKWIVPHVAMAAIYIVMVRRAIGTALLEAPVRDLVLHWCTQSKALVYYAQLLVLPSFLSVEHPFRVAGEWGESAIWTSGGLIAFSLLVAQARRHPRFQFWLLWSLLWLLPTLVLPLNVLVNEHRLYLPSMAFAVGTASLLVALVGRGALKMLIVGGLLASALGALSFQRVGDWRSAEVLWTDARAKGPYMPRPHLYMGNVHKQAGRNLEALNSYDRALKVYPDILSGGDLVSIYNNAGATYMAMGRNREAIEAYRRALQIDPQYEKARSSLDALVALEGAVRDPEAERLYRRGLVALVRGQLDEAVAMLQQSLMIQVQVATYMGLAQVHERRGDLPQVQAAYQALLTLAPDAEASALAQRRLREIAAELGQSDKP
jgi:protein O-mannosyl-transferase